jgi:hypothetical protein
VVEEAACPAYVPIWRELADATVVVRCSRSVRVTPTRIGRYVPGVQVSLRLYSDERRNSVIAFATRSGASNVRR